MQSDRTQNDLKLGVCFQLYGVQQECPASRLNLFSYGVRLQPYYNTADQAYETSEEHVNVKGCCKSNLLEDTSTGGGWWYVCCIGSGSIIMKRRR